ncbi:Zn-binding domain-containing protein [Streptomyces sp. NPDC056949]|uniref:Zn-binding domain-containing protein n=1 Tax=Streptomyces sp. NPDC056949 TaxID=3345976 RepID=UPI00362E70A0
MPVTPFPQWLRCTACNVLAAVDSSEFAFLNSNPRTPHEAKFVHDCKRGKKPLAVAARFTLVCTVGHLDEFPYTAYVHHGQTCTTIALECGYNSASLAERIYAGDEQNPRAGILIYTAVPDSEGTLGGLVSLAEEREFDRIVRRALADAGHCSADPLCSERLPHDPGDYLHGAACHVCLFVSETTCERANRFLDRRFLVPLSGDKEQVLTPVGLQP